MEPTTARTTTHLDVLIVGAGLSGIGAGHYLQTQCPWADYAIFEARDAIGGTWDLFRYPGIRSDSDMHTLGYSFRPWDGEKSIADGDSILQYIKDTARESRRRRPHPVQPPDHRGRLVNARFALARHGGAHRHQRDRRAHGVLPLLLQRLLPLRPRVPARLRRHGRLRRHHRASAGLARGARLRREEDRGHRQWRDRGHTGPGSGPVRRPRDHAAALADLHRLPAGEEPCRGDAAPILPAKQAGTAAKWFHAVLTQAFYQVSRKYPKLVRRMLPKGLERQLPAGYDIATHFTPRYDPWDQRFCAVPNGDLFKAISAGAASVVTDQIDRFTETGPPAHLGQRARGRHHRHRHRPRAALPRRHRADAWTVSRSIRPTRLTYKGMMIEGVPEHGGRHRLHQRVVDAEVRPHLRLRVPSAEPHARHAG